MHHRLLAVLVLLLLTSCGEDVSPLTAPAATGPTPTAAAGVATGCRPATAVRADANGTNTGIVRGHLYGVGGPAPGTPRAWPGTITFTGLTQNVVTARTDGAYEIALPAGRYDIVGHSPQFGGCAYVCRPKGNKPHGVAAVRTTTVDVYCSMK